MAQQQLNFAKVLGKPFVNAGVSVGQKRFGKYTMDGVGNYDTNFQIILPTTKKYQNIFLILILAYKVLGKLIFGANCAIKNGSHCSLFSKC